MTVQPALLNLHVTVNQMLCTPVDCRKLMLLVQPALHVAAM